jgi:hypothetical protein
MHIRNCAALHEMKKQEKWYAELNKDWLVEVCAARKVAVDCRATKDVVVTSLVQVANIRESNITTHVFNHDNLARHQQARKQRGLHRSQIFHITKNCKQKAPSHTRSTWRCPKHS